MKKAKRVKQKKATSSLGSEGTNEEVLHAEVRGLWKQSNLDQNIKTTEVELFTEVEVKISALSSTSDAFGHAEGSSQIYVVPFSIPGDVVLAKAIRHNADPAYTIADFVKVLKASPDRDDSLVQCRYFSTCAGCQFQMLPYEKQLLHKKTIVEKAYQKFSNIPIAEMPMVGNTIGSPLQYKYRTKLTPHFDGPQGSRRNKRNGHIPHFQSMPPIGFMQKGKRSTLDIEECPIGTEAVQKGLVRERKKVADQLDTYRKGVTILLRESTERVQKEDAIAEDETKGVRVVEDRGPHIHVKTCTSDNNSITTEYVDDYIFQNPANAFFQNNNSILPSFTAYIREHILSKDPTSAPITNLIDAYSGSGLFTITLSSLFTRSIGIDISTESITSARTNARLNNVAASSPTNATTKSQGNVTFLAADASELFDAVPSSFLPSATAVILDPPRKGCDEPFLRQLLAFGPARIVYVSCNVHTQARDVGWIMREAPYEVESVRGFDFFPQTGHVEGVAVLRRKATTEKPPAIPSVVEDKSFKDNQAVK